MATADQRSNLEAQQGVTALLLGYTLWGVFPIYFRALQAVPPTLIIAYRLVLCCVVVLMLLRLRGELASVTVKSTWPPQRPGESPVVPPNAGHKVLFEYDALGRLIAREHRGRADDEGTSSFEDRREYVWDGGTLLAEAGVAHDGEVIWRKSYAPGPTGIDDATQMRVEEYRRGGRVTGTYSFVRDEQRTVLGLLEERAPEDSRGGAADRPCAG